MIGLFIDISISKLNGYLRTEIMFQLESLYKELEFIPIYLHLKSIYKYN
jgi:hypothetical protein